MPNKEISDVTEMSGEMMIQRPRAEPPCKQACPAGIDIPRYVRLIDQGKFSEALAIIKEKMPFPAICGRVCNHPCEAQCWLNDVNRPVAIMALKRFAAERGSRDVEESKPAKSTHRRIAIIGSGPAGLTAAFYLRQSGHQVSVFEALSKPGGLLRTGIPRYQLPEHILEEEINAIIDQGIALKLDSPVKRVNHLLDEDYHAVLIATGFGSGFKLPILGAELDGVLVGTSFLQDVNMGRPIKLGQKVVVVGGGAVAFDVARTAWRLGPDKVQVVCLESRMAMPAFSWVIEEAEKEGIIIHPSLNVVKILGDRGQVTGIECVGLEWVKFDEAGKLHLGPTKGPNRVFDADTVIFAVGQRMALSLVADVAEVKITKQGAIAVNEALETGRSGVFACGDAVTGPLTVVEAIAQGRQAAFSIDKYLGAHEEIGAARRLTDEEVPPLMPSLPIGERAEMPCLSVSERIGNFSEVELGLTEEASMHEAMRCLRCDLTITVDPAKCTGCRICQLRCSLRLEKAFSLSRARISIQRLVNQDTEYSISFTNECDACGICARYCPYGALVRQDVREEMV